MEYSHGVVYKPENLKNVGYVLENASYDGFKYVRIYWIDLANSRRCRVLPLNYFKELMQANRPGVNIAKISLGLVYLMAPPTTVSFSAVGEYICVPDLSTLRPLPFAPGHLGVLGYLEEKTPYPGTDGKLTVEVPLCARSLLKRIVETTRKELNTDFIVGFETEFILLSSTRPVTASNEHQWSSPVGFLAGSKEALILEEIGDAMQASNLSLQMLHSEAAPGQYEVVSGPLSPVDAADQVIFVRELITNVASKHGLHATFSPRPFDGTAGSSAHIHISVHRKGAEKPNHGMSAEESSFLAGVLENLPALPAITLPTVASYRRMTDGVWSGGTYVHYGTENREAPIRLTNATSPGSRNFEMRFVDGTANPYLALAAILGAGLTGLKTGKKLEAKDCVGPRCAWEMSQEEREALGIKKRMPLNIEEARTNLGKNEVMREVLGKEMVESFLSVNKTLENALSNQEETEERKLSRLVEFF
ncbi:hypothetical protein V5O48_013021 [Marasmius crinis-equi]|uniref:Glutamine synthetase n=1 Tax=Marasmius crinis-equi TaxID=585013 RepID=A0ABR3F178_9AGAR